MYKIKIGNDIRVEFSVMRDGVAEDLTTATNVEVLVAQDCSTFKKLTAYDIKAVDNVVSFLLKGAEQLSNYGRYLGRYRVSISYSYPDPMQEPPLSHHSIDALAFELVAHSCQQGEASHSCPEVTTESVKIEGCIQLGADGDSAYELAVKAGFVGTLEEWLASLDGIDGINGVDGIDGIDGTDGTSAYESALAGGLPEYVTEVEFNQILAMNSEIIGDALDDINGEGYNDNVVKKIARLNNTKQGIAEAIIGKGITVTPENTFASYADKVKKIDGAVEAFYRQYGFGYAVDSGLLLTMAKQSYEETKDWMDYSKAKGNTKIRFIPLLDITNLSLANTFADCTELLAASIVIPSKANIEFLFFRCNRLISASIIGTPAPNLTSLFHACHALVDVTIDTSGTTILQAIFAGCYNLVTLPLLDFSSAINLFQSFYGCTSLNTLGGFKDVSVSFSLDQSTKLTVESLLNVLNHLADMTGKPTPLLTLGAANLAKLTDEQKAIATNKNWTLN